MGKKETKEEILAEACAYVSVLVGRALTEQEVKEIRSRFHNYRVEMEEMTIKNQREELKNRDNAHVRLIRKYSNLRKRLDLIEIDKKAKRR